RPRAFAVSHANVWRCGLKVTPVPARFRLHPHLACRLPYRFPRGRFTRLLRVRVPAPWLPYRFPRGRLGVGVTAFRQQPWLPYRFPRGRIDRRNGGSKIGPVAPYRLRTSRSSCLTQHRPSANESGVAWSGARLSTPCTELAVNFELATEAINGEFVKG